MSGVGIGMGRRMVNPQLLIQQARHLGAGRVLRGGDWSDGAYFARCADRGNAHPVSVDGNLGFRCVRGL